MPTKGTRRGESQIHPPSSKKMAMVQPVPTKEGPPSAKKIAPPAKKPVPFSIMIMRLGGGRPFTLVDEKPGYWLIHFLGDSEPTKILK